MTLVWIGDDALLDATKMVHVQDTDRINRLALVGSPDEHGIIWQAEWVETERLTSLPPVHNRPINKQQL